MLFMHGDPRCPWVCAIYVYLHNNTSVLTILADKGDHGGQKSGAIVRVTVSSLMSPHPWGDFPPQLSWSTSKRFIIIWGI